MSLNYTEHEVLPLAHYYWESDTVQRPFSLQMGFITHKIWVTLKSTWKQNPSYTCPNSDYFSPFSQLNMSRESSFSANCKEPWISVTHYKIFALQKLKDVSTWCTLRSSNCPLCSTFHLTEVFSFLICKYL